MSEKQFFMGIDPGANGAAALLDTRGSLVGLIEFKKSADQEIAEFFREFSTDIIHARIEKVHAMPKQGVSSTFKFGDGYGMLRGFLIAFQIPFGFVSPAEWQKIMECRTKGDKNVTKDAAYRIFPNLKITHAIADALLIAEYARRKHYSLRVD